MLVTLGVKGFIQVHQFFIFDFLVFDFISSGYEAVGWQVWI